MSFSSKPIRKELHHELKGHEALIDSLCECGRLFHTRGWSVGTSSNYSVVLGQHPVDLIVTGSGFDKGQLQPNQFVRVNEFGKPTTPEQPKSSAETMLHVVLAQRSEPVGSILHTHSVWGTLLSQHFYEQRGFSITDFEMLKGLEGIKTHESEVWIPIFDNTQDIPVLAEQVKAIYQTSPEKIRYGFLIRQHGLYTWGHDVFAARRHIEIFEFLFECLGRKLGY